MSQRWDGSARPAAAAAFHPVSVAALAEHLAATATPIRARGAGHSWSGVADHAANHTSIILDHPMFSAVDVPDSDGRTWVGGATTLSALHAALAAHRRSLANVGSISAQTMAGAVATGTHGAGSRLPSLSGLVCGVRAVTATGEIVEVDGGEALAHWQLALGVLGVVTAVRVHTVPLFYVVARRRAVDLDEAPDLLLALLADEGPRRMRHRFTWIPYAKRAEILSFEEVAAPDVLPEPFDVPSLRDRLEGKLLAEGVFGRGLLRVSRRWPSAAPTVCRIAAAVRFGDDPVGRVGRLFERVNEHGVPPHAETEWAVPTASAPEAWRALRAAIESRRLPCDFLQELRPAAVDGATLSAARERDVCWLSLYQATPHRWAESLAVAEDVLGGLGGRPHWGKSFDPARVRARVGPSFDHFDGHRRALDPAGRLLGPWHRACGFGAPT